MSQRQSNAGVIAVFVILILLLAALTVIFRQRKQPESKPKTNKVSQSRDSGPAHQHGRDFREPNQTPPLSNHEVMTAVPTLDNRVRQLPREIAQGVRQDPATYLPRLVATLTSAVTEPKTKVKLIHDWVCDNITYNYGAARSGSTLGTSTAEVLRSGTSVCQGFSNLFEEMCRMAGVDCVTIPGYARGVGFEVFSTENPLQSNHAWNAVKLSGRWHLIDVTWDEGHIQNGRYVKDYSNDYYLVPPSQFIYTHFPVDPKWQLLERPLTAEEFVQLPHLRGGFFRHGLQLVHPTEKVTQADDQLVVQLIAPPNISLLAELRPAGSNKAGEPITPTWANNTLRIPVTIPRPGNWVLTIYANDSPGQSLRYSEIAALGFCSRRAKSP